MPQMMPLNWLSLFMFFIALFFLINIMVYYNYNTKIKSMFENKYKLNYNWKW